MDVTKIQISGGYFWIGGEVYEIKSKSYAFKSNNFLVNFSRNTNLNKKRRHYS